MKTNNLVDVNVAIMSATRQNDWYGFQDLLSVEADYLEMSKAIRNLLDFKQLTHKETRLFDSTYNEIIVDKKLVNVDDYVAVKLEEEIVANWNSRDYDDENYSYNDFKNDYLNFNDNDKSYYEDKYETILNQMWRDYFWLGTQMKQITDTKLEMLGQKNTATVN